MDGFNVIPLDKENFKDVIPTSPKVAPKQGNTFDSSFEIIDEEKKENVITKSGGSFLYIVSVLSLVGVFVYFGFLVFYRLNILAQISAYGEQIRSISSSIDRKELEDFKVMDKTLKSINEKLGRHVLSSQVLLLVNKNIRTSLQVSEYKVDVKDKEVLVTLTSVAPTFREFAEQTEKFFAMKTEGRIKSFSVSNMSFESDTRRLRFTTQIVFDRNSMSALSVANGNN